nr:MAG TPA: hypothetical protein [Caudoviricetes sp.]
MHFCFKCSHNFICIFYAFLFRATIEQQFQAKVAF